MTSPRIAILVSGAVALLAAAPPTTLAAKRTRSHAPAVTRSDRSPDVNERAGNPDRARSDNGRSDSVRSSVDRSTGSVDRSGGSHDIGES